MPFDLVLLSLGGVQRFIVESRTTADVAGASEIVQGLARRAARVVHDRLVGSAAPCGLIFPVAPDASSITNKIAFLAPEGDGPTLARAAIVEVVKDWQDRGRTVLKSSQPPETPGVPDLAWISVTGEVAGGGYQELWRDAQREMSGRRRARVFEPVVIGQRTLCAQSAGLPAVTAPPRTPAHERDEALSASGWVKRRAGSRHFPSTVSIASLTFRRRLLDRAAADPDVAAELRGPVRRLAKALDVLERLGVPTDRATLRSAPSSKPPPAGLEALAGRLGVWVTAERWDVGGLAREFGTRLDQMDQRDVQAVRDGRRAAGALAVVARDAGIPSSSPYYAVVVQDLDRLGRALGGLDLDRQREVSHQLSALAEEQRRLLGDEHPLAELVYAGGDDLLAFCPAATALPLATAIREQIRTAVHTGQLTVTGPDGTPITASTGVAFAHMSTPLQDALRAARAAIGDAKSATSAGGRSRNALAVVVRRRGGQRARTVQPWWPPQATDGASAATLLTRIRPGPAAGALSAVLASELERDEQMLRELAAEDHRELLQAELIRLVRRHGGTRDAGTALYTLGLSERGAKGDFTPAPAALVARFLAQEAR